MRFTQYKPAGAAYATPAQRSMVAAQFESGVPDVWREIAELNFSALRRSVFFEKHTDSVLASMAVDLVYELVKNFGGHAVYIPIGNALVAAEKNELISNEFNGKNITQLAKKHRVSPMRIRQIIQDSENQKKAKTKA